ncbi:serine--tRNA ligase, mitochondrial isoform 2-T2 [Aulostomus maculatus]
MVAKAGSTALAVVMPAVRRYSWLRTGQVIPHRLCHGIRSSLYEIACEGYIDSPDLDMTAVCEETDKVITNVENRKSVLRGDDIRKIVCVWQQLQEVKAEISVLDRQKKEVSEIISALVIQKDKNTLTSLPEYNQARQKGREVRSRLNQLYAREAELDQEHYRRALMLPNNTHPDVPIGDQSQARVVELVGQKPEFDFKPRSHVELGEQLGLIRQRHLAHVSGHRTYYLRGVGARLQTALQNFALDTLQRHGFIPMVVPDILKAAVLEGCGMQPNTHHSQVYSLDPARFPDLKLAGTGEVGVAGFFMNHAVNWKDLPVRTACSSTCYRVETDTGRESWGLYRVHHFNKVEMFGVTADETGNESSQLLEEFVSLQKHIFSALELHYRVLDMPSQELGLSAYRKYDIEAWMPGRNCFGEISSGSNCTDYQSRRLSILYEREDGSMQYAHTVNATACAIPRTIIAILETHQTKQVSLC